MKLTPAMIRELRCIAATGEPSDPIEWHGAGGLWFHARDRVICALIRRGLVIQDMEYLVTATGKDVLNEQQT